MSVGFGADLALNYVVLVEDHGPTKLHLEPPPRDWSGSVARMLTELLAPVLDADAEDVATALTRNFRSLSGVLAAKPNRLAAVPGMSRAAVSLIECVHEIAGCVATETISERELIGTPAELEHYVRARLRCKGIEIAYGLFLDRKNRLLEDVLLAQGTVDHVCLYPREVVCHALRLDASAVILAHNHPSGDPTPSADDIRISREVARALATMNVTLHDHLIVGDNRIASLRELRLL